MMKMSKSLIGIGVTMLLCSVATADIQKGDEITLDFQTCSPSRTVKTNYLGSASADAANREGGSYARAGMLKWANTPIRTFCIQIGEGLAYGAKMDYTFMNIENTPDDPPYAGGMGMMRATLIRDLYSRWWSQVDASAGNTQQDEARDLCSAFQAMIWEITHENLTSTNADVPDAGTVAELSATLGAMQTNDMTTNAQGIFGLMKASLGQGGWLDFAGDNLWGLSNPNYQDQIYLVPGGAVGLAGLGLFGARRRRNRVS